MALNSRDIKQESKFPTPDPLEPGTYPGRLVQIISLGLQEQQAYKGEEKPPKPDLYVTYELVDEFLKDDDGNDNTDKPRWISERFPLHSLDADLAKSTKRYTAIDQSLEHDGDWGMLGGAPSLITVANYKVKSGKNEGKIRDKVSNVSAMRDREKDKTPELINKPRIFDVDEPDMEVFFSLPEWLQKTIKENLEFEGSVLEKAIKNYKKPDKEDDDTPDENEGEYHNDEDDEEKEDW